ncbi:alpha/beta hydrolase [Paracidovorax cattleyae]|uniref:Acetyl esterase/lipase n=1 Tax=Paracidovorax cattleyae TaxID=80868 RepID=A0A1H0K0S4_9BURK|nr:alpha/beta hydrolase [Paracidovorax cattleyae]AVS73671.1 alpha/beta hydrolase [Paracidovorax cattleyae]MBF9263508.1 alpha/beta hydrolase [Paracidovorax cattleyae]SDO49526.1 Acetyl esterase/lipase [Paracidovorax cattleyae]
MPTTASSRSTSDGARSESTIAVAPGQDVAVRMYGRRKAGETSPLVVHFHGGAFVSGDLDSGCTIAGLLQEAGALVVSVAYPLAPEHPFPQPLETGYAVLQWVYRYRTRLAGAGAPVYVAGEEAGGNLAAGVCLMARDQSHPPLAGQILVSPMLDPCAGTPSLRAATEGAEACRWAQGWEKFLRCARDAEHPYAVPGTAQRLAGLPPTLLLVGDTDPMHDETLAYASRLKAAGQLVELHVLRKAERWPDALLDSGTQACPCAGDARDRFRSFMDAGRCPAPR